jgi:hypothetical protein
MARVLITGSASGLGLMAGELLIEQGHEVVLHVRDKSRDPGIADVVVGDFASMAEVRSVAAQADDRGPFDAVIHNVALGYQERRRIVTEDGFAHVFAVNVLAPYLLTATMARPSRLVYLSSGMHRGGDPSLDDLQWEHRRWQGSQAYAVDPGWVATRMGGRGAPDDLSQAHVTQVRLALGEIGGTGGYYYHETRSNTHPAASDPTLQDAFLAKCAELTNTPLP